jgi:periplasmic protein CpxP/Spy
MKFFVTARIHARSSLSEQAQYHALSNKKPNKKMKRKIIALTTACSLALGAFTIARAQGPEDMPGPGHMHHGKKGEFGHNPLARLTQDLNLTDEQKAKVQPIIDQTKPQIEAIHQDAMQKSKTVIENSMAQIRPLLTAEQQQKFDAMKKAHEQMREAHKAMRDARDQ